MQFAYQVTLLGENGYNRADKATSMIVREGVDTDQDAINWWLATFRDKPDTTQRSYRKEISRFQMWAHLVKGRAISDLGILHMNDYVTFLENPPADWCGPSIRDRHSPHWRPFVGPLSHASVRYAMTIIYSFFSFMTSMGYFRGNPLENCNRILRRKNNIEDLRRATEKRCLSDVQRKALFAYLDRQQIYNDCFETRRARFVVCLLYFCTLRVSEVCSHKMQAFHFRDGRWWLYLDGKFTKGNKSADVPVPADLLIEVQAYRQYLGLAPLPSENDTTPLVSDIAGRAIGVRRVAQIVKETAEAVSETIEHEAEAARMRDVSTHWFRHTGATKQRAHGADVLTIKDNTRHSSVDMLGRYCHINDEQRHKSVECLTWER